MGHTVDFPEMLTSMGDSLCPLVRRLVNHNMVYKNPMDNEGKTPMHVAAYEGHADVIDKLLAHDQGELQCSDICRVFFC